MLSVALRTTKTYLQNGACYKYRRNNIPFAVVLHKREYIKIKIEKNLNEKIIMSMHTKER